MLIIQEGQSAPNYELRADDNSSISLNSFKDKKNVVLCFYPKNHLSGCPSKKSFQDDPKGYLLNPDILSIDSILFAISVDTFEDQTDFVKEYDIHIFILVML